MYKIFHNYLKIFPKQEKFSLGIKIENLILEILELFLLAKFSSKNEKINIVKQASQKIDLLKVLIRLVYETKSLNLKKYLILEQEATGIGKMTGGWIKYLKKSIYAIKEHSN